MAVNQSHTENRRGALIPFGESVLKQSQDVDLSFLQQPVGYDLFNGTTRGTLFLTSYRVIFVTSHLVNDPMLSFMMPFGLMSNCTIQQPIFAPNYIKGTIQAAPDAYPVVVYRPPPPGYRAPPAGYGASPAGYGAPLGGYGAPPGEYVAPPVGYEAPRGGYGAPPAGYGTPPVPYEALPAGYGAPPAGNEAPPPAYEAPPAGNRAASHKSVAAQPEASLPSTSSSQAHLPPSKK
ncbi:hypothetical protein EI555_007786 [Monodon monoceros]|uniref:GRAM domain-containing protein n=1 Tax=Monodon monoceros TaxID=40151 RepID=A0A4U1ERG3_MONMO|nr:hypothetical protein EI555_007786 [Monodon monoceros]